MPPAVSTHTSGHPANRAVAATAGSHPRRARWWLELLIIAWLAWVYDAINNLAPLREQLALAHARGLLSLESTLHIDPEHALDRWLASHHTLGLAISDYYDNAHFLVTLGLLGLLWWRRADIYRPLRSVLVVVNLLGFLVFWLYPVAPPRMLRGFTDVVASTHAFGSSLHSGTGALASHANELAAMPSLHIAWAVWCGIVLWQLSRRRAVRVLAWAYPLLTTFAVLATGNHFVLDVLAGIAVLALAVALVAGLQALHARQALRLRVPAVGAPALPRSLRPAPPSSGPRLAARQKRSGGVERTLGQALEAPAE